MGVHLRSAFHPLLGRVRIGASRVRPLFPELHTSDYSVACPGSSTWVDKVPSRDTPSLNLTGHRGGVAPGFPQVAHAPSYSRGPLVPSPAERRCQAAASSRCMISSAVPDTAGWRSQDVNCGLTPPPARSPCPPCADPSPARRCRRRGRQPPRRTVQPP